MATSISKPRVIKDFDKLGAHLQEQIKLAYPLGFENSLISFKNRDGNRVSALPFEGEDKYYLVRMTIAEAQQLIEENEDDEEGELNEDISSTTEASSPYDLETEDQAY